MENEKLEWQEVNQLGIGKIAENVDILTKQVIMNEINEVGAKLKMLETMGIVHKDNPQLKQILEEIEKLKAIRWS